MSDKTSEVLQYLRIAHINDNCHGASVKDALSDAIIALDKQIPKAAVKKPIFEGERAEMLRSANIKGFVNYETLKCPICNHIVADRTPKGFWVHKYCDNCGQALTQEEPTA